MLDTPLDLLKAEAHSRSVDIRSQDIYPGSFNCQREYFGYTSQLLVYENIELWQATEVTRGATLTATATTERHKGIGRPTGATGRTLPYTQLSTTTCLPADLALHASRVRHCVEHRVLKAGTRNRRAYPAYEPLRSGVARRSLTILDLLRPLDCSKYRIRLTPV